MAGSRRVAEPRELGARECAAFVHRESALGFLASSCRKERMSTTPRCGSWLTSGFWDLRSCSPSWVGCSPPDGPPIGKPRSTRSPCVGAAARAHGDVGAASHSAVLQADGQQDAMYENDSGWG